MRRHDTTPPVEDTDQLVERTARPADGNAPPADGGVRLVEGGAGTGTTTAVVEHIVGLVRAGVSPTTILALTGSDAAAVELRSRLHEALHLAVRDGSVPADAVASAADTVCTLHQLARRLVDAHPIEAGLPPGVEVLDEIRSFIDLDQRWVTFVDALFDRPDLADVLLRSFATGLDLDALRSVARTFQQQRHRLPVHDPPAPPPLRPVDAATVIDAIGRAVASWQPHPEHEARLVRHVRWLAELSRSLADASAELEVLHLLATSGPLTYWRGRADDPIDDALDEVIAATALADQARNDLLGVVRGEILDRLVEEVRRFTLRSADERARAGRLAFHDLVPVACDLLRSTPQLQASLRERHRHVVVDGLPVTEPLQVELAVLLAAEGDVRSVSARADWRQVHLPSGRLFATHDIVPLTGPDPALPAAVAGARVRLTTSFRSAPAIVDWVNQVFADLVGDDHHRPEGRRPSTRFEPLHAAAEAVHPAGRVVVLGHQHALPVDAVHEIEAAEIAGAVRAAVDDGWPVRDRSVPSRPAVRPARWSDIAVLLPSASPLDHLEASFRAAGIPYRLRSPSLIWRTPEVRELLHLLQAIDDPTDEVALVAALRSPMFACSDDDLVTFRTAGGRWDGRSDPADTIDPHHPVVAALDVIEGLRQDRWWLGLSGLLDRVVRDLRFPELVDDPTAPDQRGERSHRLRMVLGQARAFEAAPGATLTQFLAWARRRASGEAASGGPVPGEAPLPVEADDDAVQVLTVQSASGQGFPIAVLTGLARRPDRPPASVIWRSDGSPHVTIGPFRTTGSDAAAEAGKALARDEALAPLYVGTTRAEDHLVVSLHRPERPFTMAHELARVCDAHPDLWRPLIPPVVTSVDVSPRDHRPDRPTY